MFETFTEVKKAIEQGADPGMLYKLSLIRPGLLDAMNAYDKSRGIGVTAVKRYLKNSGLKIGDLNNMTKYKDAFETINREKGSGGTFGFAGSILGALTSNLDTTLVKMLTPKKSGIAEFYQFGKDSFRNEYPSLAKILDFAGPVAQSFIPGGKIVGGAGQVASTAAKVRALGGAGKALNTVVNLGRKAAKGVEASKAAIGARIPGFLKEGYSSAILRGAGLGSLYGGLHSAGSNVANSIYDSYGASRGDTMRTWLQGGVRGLAPGAITGGLLGAGGHAIGKHFNPARKFKNADKALKKDIEKSVAEGKPLLDNLSKGEGEKALEELLMSAKLNSKEARRSIGNLVTQSKEAQKADIQNILKETIGESKTKGLLADAGAANTKAYGDFYKALKKDMSEGQNRDWENVLSDLNLRGVLKHHKTKEGLGPGKEAWHEYHKGRLKDKFTNDEAGFKKAYDDFRGKRYNEYDAAKDYDVPFDSPHHIDYVNRSLGTKIAEAESRGQLGVVRDLTSVKKKFQDIADELYPEFKVARQAHKRLKTMEEAGNLGKEYEKLYGRRGADLQKQYEDIMKDEALSRIFEEAQLESIGKKAGNAASSDVNLYKKLLNEPTQDIMAGTPLGASALKRLDPKSRAIAMLDRIQGGSQTAEKLAVKDQAGRFSGNLFKSLKQYAVKGINRIVSGVNYEKYYKNLIEGVRNPKVLSGILKKSRTGAKLNKLEKNILKGLIAYSINNHEDFRQKKSTNTNLLSLRRALGIPSDLLRLLWGEMASGRIKY